MYSTKCLIVDDEPVAQRIIEHYLLDFQDFELVASCLNALEARKVLEDQKVDLLFLDLEMPKLKGFPFLKTLDSAPAVIITTAYREYALEGFENNVVDYLLKPISFERFIRAIDKYHISRNNLLLDTSRKKVVEHLIFRSNRKTIKMSLVEILYIKGLNNYIQICTATRKYTVYSSLQEILSQLNHNFVRIHRSYIVNRNKVNAYSQDRIEIGEIIIPVGITFRKKVKQLYS